MRAGVAFVAISASLDAGVFVVDAAMGPGADFPDVLGAMDWIAPHDVLLVRPGDYTAATTGHTGNPIYVDRALTVVADSTTRPSISIVMVTNLPANEQVVFRGFDITASQIGGGCSSDAYPKGLIVSQCSGSVVFEDCTFFGGLPSVVVEQSESVTFTRCKMFPTSFVYTCFAAKTTPGRGVEISNSNVVLQSCEIHGGNGANASPAAHTPGIEGAKPGAAAILVDGGGLFLGRTSLIGGTGGDGTFDGFGQCYQGAIGGTGLQITASGGLVRTLDSTILAGVSGVSAGSCAPPPSAPATDLAAGSLVSLSGESNTLIGPTPSLEGSNVSIAIQAPAGQTVVALASAVLQSAYQPTGSSVLHVGLPAVIVPLGVVPVGGTIHVATTVPFVVASDSAISVILQAANISPSTGAWRLGSPSVAVIVDP